MLQGYIYCVRLVLAIVGLAASSDRGVQSRLEWTFLGYLLQRGQVALRSDHFQLINRSMLESCMVSRVALTYTVHRDSLVVVRVDEAQLGLRTSFHS